MNHDIKLNRLTTYPPQSDDLIFQMCNEYYSVSLYPQHPQLAVFKLTFIYVRVTNASSVLSLCAEN
jgi:hypothetical protein